MDIATVVASQVIPIDNDKLVLPNTAVAEIIDFGQVSPVDQAPSWLLGMADWRGLQLPVLSFEALTGRSVPATGRHARIAVCNALGGQEPLRFFGLLTQGIPQLVKLDKGSVAAVDDDSEANPVIACHAVINGEVVVIPDMDAIEARIRSDVSGA